MEAFTMNKKKKEIYIVISDIAGTYSSWILWKVFESIIIWYLRVPTWKDNNQNFKTKTLE